MTTTASDVLHIKKSTIVRFILGYLSLLPLTGTALAQTPEIGLGMVIRMAREAASPLAVTPDMREWIHRQVPGAVPPELRWRRLAWLLVDSPELRITETPLATVTAAEAFRTRRANCVAFALLGAAFARELGLDAYFVLTQEVEGLEGRGDLKIAYGHLAVGFGPAERRTVLDLGGLTRPSRRRMRRVSDLTAMAIFYSNRGAEELLESDLESALPWLRRAVEIAPWLPRAWVNLGVAERRAGDSDAAASAYRRALAIDPELEAALENLEVLERRKAGR